MIAGAVAAQGHIAVLLLLCVVTFVRKCHNCKSVRGMPFFFFRWGREYLLSKALTLMTRISCILMGVSKCLQDILL